MGAGTNLKSGGQVNEQNIDTQDIPNFPAYIRFEPKRGTDKWEVNELNMTVNPGPGQIRFIVPYTLPTDALILGDDCGKYIFLQREA